MLKKFVAMILCAFTAIVLSGCFSSKPDISGIYLGEEAGGMRTLIIELVKGADMKGDDYYKTYKDGYVVNVYEFSPTASEVLERDIEKHDWYALPPDENGIIRIYKNPKGTEEKPPTPYVVKLQENGDLFGVTSKAWNPFYKKMYAKQKEKSVDDLSARLKREYRQKGK